MKDPDRIDPFLQDLAAFWKEHPDWRFGQLVMNLTRDPALGRVRDPWEWDVEEFVLAMDTYIEEADLTDEFLINRLTALGVSEEGAKLLVEEHRRQPEREE